MEMPKMLQLKPGQMFTCAVCGKGIEGKYVIYDAASGLSYHTKHFQESRKKNPKNIGSITKLEVERLVKSGRAVYVYKRKGIVVVDGYRRYRLVDKNPILPQEQENELRRLKKSFPFRIVYGVVDKDTGQFQVYAGTSMRIPNKLTREGHAVFVLKNPKQNPIRNSLYESFHGTSPAHSRVVQYEPPTSPLVKIGRLSELKYKPESPSKHKGTEFYHVSGDTGETVLKSNLILATNQKGTALYLVKDRKSKHPFFNERGIIG